MGLSTIFVGNKILEQFKELTIRVVRKHILDQAARPCSEMIYPEL